MAQTGYTPILIYSSNTGGNTPAAGNLTNSTLGSELAINITDGKLFYKDNANAVQVIGWKTTPTTAGGTGVTSYSAGDLLYYATGTTLSKLAIGGSGQILKSTGSAPAWENVSALAVTSISFGTTGLTPSTATQGAVTVAGTLVAANGGTGQSSYTVGDILYASGTTTLSKLADVATGNALISGGVGVAPSWGKIGLTTHVSGTLPTANGGTNLTSFTGSGIVYASSTSALATGGVLTFDGTTLQNSNAIASGRSGGSNGSFLLNRNDGVQVGSISVNTATGSIDLTTAYGYFTFTNYLGEQFKIDNANVKVSSGNLTFGGASKGVQFASVLNAYEEGTWTPTVTANSGTITSYTSAGTYTKIGRLVTANFRVTITNQGTAVGPILATLPFQAGNYATAIGGGREDGTSGYALETFVYANSTFAYVTLYQNGNTAITNYVLLCSVTYFV